MSKLSTIDANKYLQDVHKELGVSIDYADTCGLQQYLECDSLQETELDVFARQPLMEVSAYEAWQAMKAAALKDNIELQIISAYRSIDYQKQLILNKIAKGQALIDILKVNAAPGYSEHHSGQAVDIGSPGYEHLSESFEYSPAFRWLSANADSYGYSLSFPKNNPSGVTYEPWHWKFS